LDPCVIQVGKTKFHMYFCGGGKINKDGKQVWHFKNYRAKGGYSTSPIRQSHRQSAGG
jgi:hypothetical protein